MKNNHPAKTTPALKGKLHPRNPHQGRYDLVALCKTTPELKAWLRNNPAGEPTIDFSNEQAVLCLNKALLHHFYHIRHWQIPEDYLCPPIPGRADYIHYLSDLLAKNSPNNETPSGSRVKALDIGTGANLIYPIIGSQSYGWHFTASDIDPVAVKTAQLITNSNEVLKGKIRALHQPESRHIFKGIVRENDRFDVTLCNPPFHASLAEAQAGTQRKWRNLQKGTRKGAPAEKAKLNFGGQKSELWCEGGEVRFLKQMINESYEYRDQVCWFTSLVSKGDNIQPLKRQLKLKGAVQIEVINMSQGQKISRLLAWSFFNQQKMQQWALEHWH